MNHHSFNTVLQDRTLWYDGDSTYDSDQLLQLVNNHDIKYVDKINDLVKQYNNYVAADKQLTIKQDCQLLPHQWIIPAKYKKLDVIDYVCNKHQSLFDDTQRDIRLAKEFALYKKYDLFDVLRTIIYIINTLDQNNVVWGVGRGSSVSSYILYIIGVHDVDSYLYDLDINDFLHD